ncbi:hypothetical protein CASFOL_003405 [Castilleja foliolosa]|uniref:Uncharacterized protein n=1 Tax=Castilleja foliolosa TaxID=1961234 RepID=A0ABD3EKG6_9LAMI
MNLYWELEKMQNDTGSGGTSTPRLRRRKGSNEAHPEVDRGNGNHLLVNDNSKYKSMLIHTYSTFWMIGGFVIRLFGSAERSVGGSVVFGLVGGSAKRSVRGSAISGFVGGSTVFGSAVGSVGWSALKELVGGSAVRSVEWSAVSLILKTLGYRFLGLGFH